MVNIFLRKSKHRRGIVAKDCRVESVGQFDYTWWHRSKLYGASIHGPAFIQRSEFKALVKRITRKVDV